MLKAVSGSLLTVGILTVGIIRLPGVHVME